MCEKIIIGTPSVIQLGRSVIILVNVKSIGAFSLEIRLWVLMRVFLFVTTFAMGSMSLARALTICQIFFTAYWVKWEQSKLFTIYP